MSVSRHAARGFNSPPDAAAAAAAVVVDDDDDDVVDKKGSIHTLCWYAGTRTTSFDMQIISSSFAMAMRWPMTTNDQLMMMEHKNLLSFFNPLPTLHPVRSVSVFSPLFSFHCIPFALLFFINSFSFDTPFVLYYGTLYASIGAHIQMRRSGLGALEQAERVQCNATRHNVIVYGTPDGRSIGGSSQFFYWNNRRTQELSSLRFVLRREQTETKFHSFVRIGHQKEKWN